MRGGELVESRVAVDPAAELVRVIVHPDWRATSPTCRRAEIRRCHYATRATARAASLGRGRLVMLWFIRSSFGPTRPRVP
jgi:hypothetical protein